MTAEVDRVERAYRDLGARLWRALLGYTGDPEIASDALAEAFAQALARGNDLRSLEDWVWTSAFRIAAGMLKKQHMGEQLPSEERYGLPEPVADLVHALSRISKQQRLAVVMHDYGDRPTHEVATVMGVSPATVYVHLHQGRKRLRKLLEGFDE
ncbi:MAG: sigma-70 family RNA polymerase sigma factor [Actinomycetota bacterium]|nr:sigma-70 family RNA polymerase sigma factor [Actinomycetota bacterium]MDH5313674.1 sigma-70 family RNA polymerase sigma factor [Actinomycetota bacterium]